MEINTTILFSILISIFITSTLGTPTSAADITGTIDLPLEFPSAAAVTKVWIDGGLYKSEVRANGKFRVEGVHDGEHVLQVISPHLSYDKIRISLWEGGYTAFAMDDSASWDRRGRAVPMPLDIRHTGALQFTRKEPSMIIAAIKSPLVLLSIGSMVIALGLPKLITAAASAAKTDEQTAEQGSTEQSS